MPDRTPPSPAATILSNALAGALIAAVLALAVSALADGDPSTDSVGRYVPYSGTIVRDGTPFSGSLGLEFTLTDADDPTTPAWSETQTVNAYSGRFDVVLGATSQQSVDDLGALIAKADELMLTITPEGATEPLLHGKRFLPVPYAAWSAAATNPLIEGSDSDGATAALTVVSTNQKMLLAGGTIDTPQSALYFNDQSGQETRFGGAVSALGNDLYLLADATAGTSGGRFLIHQTSDQLTFNFNADFAGGMRFGSPVTLADAATTHPVPGAVLANADVTVAGGLNIGSDSNSCANATTCACAAGMRATAGGVQCSGTAVDGDDTFYYRMWYSRPSADGTAWEADCIRGTDASNGSGSTPHSGTRKTPDFVYVHCMAIQSN